MQARTVLVGLSPDDDLLTSAGGGLEVDEAVGIGRTRDADSGQGGGRSVLRDVVRHGNRRMAESSEVRGVSRTFHSKSPLGRAARLAAD